MTPQFKTFVDIWNNPKSGNSPPITASGSGYANLLTTFDEKWVAGKVSDLQAGLQQVDSRSRTSSRSARRPDAGRAGGGWRDDYGRTGPRAGTSG